MQIRTSIFEDLETRALFAASVGTAAIDDAGKLVVTGTNKSDYITVTLKSGDSSKLIVSNNGHDSEFNVSDVTAGIVIGGGNGSDWIAVNETEGDITLKATISGGNGHDTVHGGSGDDNLDGGNGKDKLYGMAGDDREFGGNGTDMIYGNAGDDNLTGGNGMDHLNGDDGDDDLEGGNGPDDLHGGAGNDDFKSSHGHDEFVDIDADDNNEN